MTDGGAPDRKCPSRLLKNSFVCVAGGDQGRQEFRNVIWATGFHRDIDGGVPQVDSVIGPVVGGFNDVGPVVSEDSSKAIQRTGIVG